MDRYDNAPIAGEFGITDQQRTATKVISSENFTTKYLIFSCPFYNCCHCTAAADDDADDIIL